MTVWYILCSFGTFSGFGIMYQAKSGNPAAEQQKRYKLKAYKVGICM
jgi:hypothetical protein